MSATNNPARRHVVLCDREGNRQGIGDVLEAHRQPGMLHKAFSVFVFRDGGREVLIQQRSERKRLFSRRWANSCCSHPGAQDDDLIAAAKRRLHDECGFTVPLEQAGSFVYRAEDPAARGVEHEYDTVLIGHAPEAITVQPDPAEVAAWKWIPVSQLKTDLQEHPDRYAPWLAKSLQLALAKLSRQPMDQD